MNTDAYIAALNDWCDVIRATVNETKDMEKTDAKIKARNDADRQVWRLLKDEVDAKRNRQG